MLEVYFLDEQLNNGCDAEVDHLVKTARGLVPYDELPAELVLEDSEERREGRL